MNDSSQVTEVKNSVSVTTQDTNRFLAKMYSIMFVAILFSAFVAFILPFTPFAEWLIAKMVKISDNTWLTFAIVVGVPLALIIGINITKGINPVLSIFLLMALAGFYGVIISVVAWVFAGEAVLAFICSSIVFIVMAILGVTVKRDISNLGAYAFAALIGLVVATVVNMFVGNSTFDLIMSFVGVIIFTIFIATDSQAAKMSYVEMMNDKSVADGDKKRLSTALAIDAALELYMDFINLFMDLLRIFASSDD